MNYIQFKQDIYKTDIFNALVVILSYNYASTDLGQKRVSAFLTPTTPIVYTLITPTANVHTLTFIIFQFIHYELAPISFN